MNIGKLTAIVALAAGLGATAPALAAWDDETGLTSLGIDISTAGGSPETVRQFIAGLAPDTQRGVLNGCQTAVAQPEGYAPNVVTFCEQAIGASPAPVLGFMSDQPAIGFPAEEPFATAPVPSAGGSSGSAAY